MKITRMVTAFSLLVSMMVGVAEVAAYELAIYTENSGINNFRNQEGKIVGHNTAIVREIMRRLGREFTIEMVPWRRGYLLAQQQPNTALFSVARIAEREDKFKWVGPLDASYFVFLKKRGNPLTITSLEDAKKVRSIGCYKDDVREKYLLRHNFTNLDSIYGEDANIINLRKLLGGRIDLWITNTSAANMAARSLGVASSEYEVAYKSVKYTLYLAFSKATPDAIVREWQRTLEAIKKDGTYKKIMSRSPESLERITFEKSGPAQL